MELPKKQKTEEKKKHQKKLHGSGNPSMPALLFVSKVNEVCEKTIRIVFLFQRVIQERNRKS